MRRLGLIAMVAAGAELAGGGGAGSLASPPPSGAVTWGTWGDSAAPRRWRLYVPAGRERGAPMVVMLHGCTQDAEDVARGTRLDDAADRHGFLVLYPEQPAGANPLKCWNWFDAAHQRRDAGEPALLAGLIDRVAAERGVDRTRVHVAGISAGGAMATILAAAYPERFASAFSASGMPIGAVTGAAQAWQVMRAGATAEQATPGAVRERMGARARPVPLLVVHGSEDRTVVALNGRRAAEQWAQAFGGQALGEEVTGPGEGTRASRTVRWRDASGVEVAAFTEIHGLGHAWSGGAPAGTYTDAQGPDASELLARFVARHALPAGGGR